MCIHIYIYIYIYIHTYVCVSLSLSLEPGCARAPPGGASAPGGLARNLVCLCCLFNYLCSCIVYGLAGCNGLWLLLCMCCYVFVCIVMVAWRPGDARRAALCADRRGSEHNTAKPNNTCLYTLWQIYGHLLEPRLYNPVCQTMKSLPATLRNKKHGSLPGHYTTL